MKKALFSIFIALTILCVDIWSKAWIVSHLPFSSFGEIRVFEGFFGVSFSIVHTTNLGAAWGLFASYPMLLLGFRLAIMGGIILALLKVKEKFPLFLILSGAIGNVLDFFIYGHVVDFLYFRFGSYSYPVFNIADSAIFCGIALLMIQSLIHGKLTRQPSSN